MNKARSTKPKSGSATKYPDPDRSNFTANSHRDDADLPEGDLGFFESSLPDGRPYRVESWFTEGMSLATVLFSTRDIERATPKLLLALVAGLLVKMKIPAEYRRLSTDSVRIIEDASGNPMYSLTFVVGMPEL